MTARAERLWLAGLLAGGLAVRLVWGFATRGLEFDMLSYETLAHGLVTLPRHVYEPGIPAHGWPYPTGYFPYIWLGAKVHSATGFPISSWVNIAPSLSDCGIAALVYAYLRRTGTTAFARLAAVALVMAGPVFLVISGYHGQQDSVATVFAVAAVVVWTHPRVARRALWAGLLLGIGASVKTVPILMLLALLPSARSRREALTLVGIAVAVPFVLLLPWLATTPHDVVRNLRYQGGPSFGGLTLVLQPAAAAGWLVEFFHPQNAAVHFVMSAGVLFNGVLVLAVGALLYVRRTEPVRAAVVIWLVVWAFGSGLFIQYFVWGIPFLLMDRRLRLVAGGQLLLLGPIAIFYFGPWRERASVTVFAILMILVWIGTVAVLAQALSGRGRPRVRLPRWSAWEVGSGVALTAIAFAPLTAAIARSWKHGGRATGADGIFPGDQLQYIWWIRDVGSHGLASNGFDLAPSAHVFTQPMLSLSGLLARAGVSPAVAFQLWKPVAVLAVCGAFALYVRRVCEPRERGPALVLSLFFAAPAWLLTEVVHGGLSTQIAEAAGRLFVGDNLQGYLPASLAFAAMPVCLLCLERRRMLGAAAAGLLAAWLHPWQGEVLLLVMAGLVLWSRFEAGWPRYVVPAVATLLPVAYYFALSRLDGAWEIGQRQNEATLGWGGLVLVIAPLAALAVPGARRPVRFQDRAVVLWVGAAILAAAISPSVPTHALGAVSLPLGILAARGLARAPRVAVIGALALLCLPGMAIYEKDYLDLMKARVQPHWLTWSEATALDRLRDDPRPGGVLAQPQLAYAVPAETGRRVWSGHPSWTPDFGERTQQAAALFAGTRSDARAFVDRTGARFLVSGCAAPAPDLSRQLGPGWTRRTFGCAALYTRR